MKVMFELDGIRAVVSDLRSKDAGVQSADDVEVLEHDHDAGENISAAFVFEGTRDELLGTARAIDALMARLRTAGKATEASLPYDFETNAVMATEWAS